MIPFAQKENAEPSTSVMVQTLKPTAEEFVQEKENIFKQVRVGLANCIKWFSWQHVSYKYC